MYLACVNRLSNSPGSRYGGWILVGRFHPSPRPGVGVEEGGDGVGIGARACAAESNLQCPAEKEPVPIAASRLSRFEDGSVREVDRPRDPEISRSIPFRSGVPPPVLGNGARLWRSNPPGLAPVGTEEGVSSSRRRIYPPPPGFATSGMRVPSN